MDETNAPTGPKDAVRLSVVVPAYNEEARLPRTLAALKRFAAAESFRVEIVVVDDGSTDRTREVVRAFDPSPAGLHLLANDANRGKGYSVRRGALAAGGEAVLVMDADMDTPVEEVHRLLPWLSRGYGVVIGSRAMPDSVIDPPRPWARRLASRGFAAVRRRVILPDLLDTQCGFKCYSRPAAGRVFAAATCDGYAADCEALALAGKLGFRVKEVGVRWESQPDSHIRIARDGPAMLRDLLAIRRRVARL